MMKTFIVTYTTNYGLAVMIINSQSLETAELTAIEKGAWPGFSIEELDKDSEGLVYNEYS